MGTPAPAQPSTSENPTKNTNDLNIKQSLSNLPPPEKKSKPLKRKFTPLRIPIPNEDDCKLSDDLADSVKTVCHICQAPVTLTGMRSHTMLQHKIQITKYKELYGPFQIIEHVFHKCHLCGKIMLLDSDAMGAHIKNTHKMKEKEYKKRFMTYQSASRSDLGDATEDNRTSCPKVEHDFTATFPDNEYVCNLNHWELNDHDGLSVYLEHIEERDIEYEEFEKVYAKTKHEDNDGFVKYSYAIGQGGWTKKFLPTDVMLGKHLKNDTQESDIDIDIDDYDNLDCSDELVDLDSSKSSDEGTRDASEHESKAD